MDIDPGHRAKDVHDDGALRPSDRSADRDTEAPRPLHRALTHPHRESRARFAEPCRRPASQRRMSKDVSAARRAARWGDLPPTRPGRCPDGASMSSMTSGSGAGSILIPATVERGALRASAGRPPGRSGSGRGTSRPGMTHVGDAVRRHRVGRLVLLDADAASAKVGEGRRDVRDAPGHLGLRIRGAERAGRHDELRSAPQRNTMPSPHPHARCPAPGCRDRRSGWRRGSIDNGSKTG